MGSFQSKDDKILALIVHFAAFCRDANKVLSKTLLNKYFYSLDFGHYALHEATITGLAYKKDQYGPVPTEIGYYLDVLLENEDLFIEDKVHTQAAKVFAAYNTPFDRTGIDLKDYFSAAEIDTIEKTQLAFVGKTAESASDETHYQYAWLSTPKQEYIPFEGAKYCAFEWLGYYGEGKDKADYEETKEIREDIAKNYKLNRLMREALAINKPIGVTRKPRTSK